MRYASSRGDVWRAYWRSWARGRGLGALSGSRRWSQVRLVQDSGETIDIVGANGNILIVPRRAFADSRARAHFLEAAMRWHAAAHA